MIDVLGVCRVQHDLLVTAVWRVPLNVQQHCVPKIIMSWTMFVWPAKLDGCALPVPMLQKTTTKINAQKQKALQYLVPLHCRRLLWRMLKHRKILLKKSLVKNTTRNWNTLLLTPLKKRAKAMAKVVFSRATYQAVVLWLVIRSKDLQTKPLPIKQKNLSKRQWQMAVSFEFIFWLCWICVLLNRCTDFLFCFLRSS